MSEVRPGTAAFGAESIPAGSAVASDISAAVPYPVNGMEIPAQFFKPDSFYL
jgi:hypothetical protein